MLQQRGKTGHLDNVAVAFHADHVDGFTAGSLHVRPVGGAAVVAGGAGIFSDQDGPVARPVVPFVEEVDELVGRQVVVDVGDDAIGDGGWETGSVGRRGYDGDVRVCGMDGIVDLREPVGVGSAAAVEVVFVANLDVLDVPRFGAAVLCT